MKCFDLGIKCLDLGITCLDPGIKCLDLGIKCLDLGISSGPGDGKNSEDEDTETWPVKNSELSDLGIRKGSWDVYFVIFGWSFFIMSTSKKKRMWVSVRIGLDSWINLDTSVYKFVPSEIVLCYLIPVFSPNKIDFPENDIWC